MVGYKDILTDSGSAYRDVSSVCCTYSIFHKEATFPGQ